jgi:archaellum component FlaC
MADFIAQLSNSLDSLKSSASSVGSGISRMFNNTQESQQSDPINPFVQSGDKVVTGVGIGVGQKDTSPGMQFGRPSLKPVNPARTIRLPQVVLTLGDYTFIRHEIPEKIALGGEQRLVIHEMVGGGRVVDTLGKSYDPISWSGLFLGNNALETAKYLDYLRQQGKPLDLKWSEMDYSVVIRKFNYEFVRLYRIPYSITCEVVSDASKQVEEGFDNDVDQALKDDMGVAVEAANNLSPDLSSTKKQVSALQQTINGVKSFVKTTQATIKNVKDQVQSVQSEITQQIAAVNNTLQDVTTLGGVLPNNSVSRGAGNLMKNVKDTNNQVQLMNLKYTLGRMDKNLTGIKVPR